MENSEILMVGNYCHDTLINPRGIFEELGGSASYISAALAGMGVQARTIAKVGLDFRYLDRVRTAPLISREFPTTHFIDDTTSGKRVATLKSVCAPILASDLPRSRARIGIVSGVAMEILPETLVRVRELTDTVICDAQGLIRMTDSESRVHNRPFAETAFVTLLGKIDYLKVSENEARLFDLTDVPRSLTILLTEGKAGCRVLREGHDTKIHAFPMDEIDATGAGDCFVAGFAQALTQGLNVERAARRANFVAAWAVSQVGVPDFSGMKIPPDL